MLVALGAVIVLAAAVWAMARAGDGLPAAAGGAVVALWGFAALGAQSCRRLRP